MVRSTVTLAFADRVVWIHVWREGASAPNDAPHPSWRKVRPNTRTTLPSQAKACDGKVPPPVFPNRAQDRGDRPPNRAGAQAVWGDTVPMIKVFGEGCYAYLMSKGSLVRVGREVPLLGLAAASARTLSRQAAYHADRGRQ